jgi:hypothetical protein
MDGFQKDQQVSMSSRWDSREFRQCGRQLAHVINHQRRAMLQQTSPVLQSAMASSAKAYRGHPGAAGGVYAGRAVLDDETAIRRCREPLRGIKEQIGHRLAARNHCRAEKVFTKMPQETG